MLCSGVCLMGHQIGLLFFNYHNDARSNKHEIQPRLTLGKYCKDQRRKYSKMDKRVKDKLVRSSRENGGG